MSRNTLLGLINLGIAHGLPLGDILLKTESTFNWHKKRSWFWRFELLA